LAAQLIHTANGVTVAEGDALELINVVVEDGTVNLVFADPPYNLGKKFGSFRDRWASDEAYASWCGTWLDMCIRKLAPDGTLYVMTSTQAMPYIDLYLRSRLTVLSRIVWAYDSSGVQAKRFFGSLYEPILHAVKDRAHYTFNAEAVAVEAKTGAVRRLIDYRKPTPALYNSRKVPGNVWHFPRVRYRMEEYESHPSQKPEALLERILLASSDPGDLVLDPFAGTFTSGAVAQRLGRRFVGIELEREYVKIGLRRLHVADELDGEKLSAPAKTAVRRNGRHRVAEVRHGSGDLFGGAG
jgi:adenine-specific DNA-methyltransferase